MRCPFCSSDDSQVKDSRPGEDGTVIRRRRQCGTCGQRFTTFERVQLREMTVLKRGGRRAPFDRDKLARSVRIALRKRPIEDDQVEQLVSAVVRRLEGLGETEITSEQIGAFVMQALSALDAVGYVRYASVYKDFREVEDFGRFLNDEKLSDDSGE